MDNLKYLRTTSKKALLDSALIAARGDYEEAGKIFDLYNSRLNLPDVDVIPPSTFSQITDKASVAFQWINENQSTIVDWITMIRGLMGKSNVSMPLPPINPLPKI